MYTYLKECELGIMHTNSIASENLVFVPELECMIPVVLGVSGVKGGGVRHGVLYSEQR